MKNKKSSLKTTKKVVKKKEIKPYDDLLRKIFLLILALIAIIFLLYNLKSVFAIINKLISSISPVIFGAILAYVVHPFYQFVYDNLENEPLKIKKDTHKKLVSTIASVVMLLAIVIGLLYLLIPEIYKSISNIIANFDNTYSSFNRFIDGLVGQNQFLYENINNVLNELRTFVQTTVLPNLRTLVGNISQGIFVTAKVIANFFIGIIVMIYVINMKDQTIAFLKKLLHTLFNKDMSEKIIEEAKYANSVFVGFISGKLLDSLIIGVICAIGLFVLNMPYSILISVIVGITNIIPFFGPFIGFIPSFILIVLVDPIKALIFLVFILILQQIDGNIIGPKILGNSTGVDSFFVLFSILFFGGLFGFIGMIIGVPLFAVLSRIITELMDSRLKANNLPTDLEDYKEK